MLLVVCHYQVNAPGGAARRLRRTSSGAPSASAVCSPDGAGEGIASLPSSELETRKSLNFRPWGRTKKPRRCPISKRRALFFGIFLPYARSRSASSPAARPGRGRRRIRRGFPRSFAQVESTDSLAFAPAELYITPLISQVSLCIGIAPGPDSRNLHEDFRDKLFPTLAGSFFGHRGLRLSADRRM